MIQLDVDPVEVHEDFNEGERELRRVVLDQLELC
jgi:hypothetical protein